MMINKAIAKITDEMMAANNPAIQAIEEHLTAKCTNEYIAVKILAEDKTLQGAFKEIEAVAKTRKVGNCGYVSEKEGFEIVDKYFGINEVPEDKPASINVLDLL